MGVSTCDVLVIGAGVAGTSIACELAGRRVRVAVAERGVICSGSSALNAGGVRQQFSHETSVRVAKETIRRMTVFAEEYGISVSFRQAGYLFLHNGGRHEVTLRRAVATQNACGVPTRLVDVDEVAKLVPGINTADVRGAAFGPTDGYVDPNSVVAGFAARARASGAVILQESPVTALETMGGRVSGVVAGSHRLAPDLVVNAAGVWSTTIAGLYGRSLPIRARRNQIFVVDRTPAPGRWLPLTIDLVSGLYFHSEGEGLLSGLAESLEIPDPPAAIPCDWGELPVVVERLVHRVPELQVARVTHGWAGMIEVTPDDNPIVGWTHLENVYTAAGFSGHGMCLAPGLAPQVARELSGQDPELALDIYRLERFEHGGVEAEGVWGGTGIAAGTAEVPDAAREARSSEGGRR
jgi:sarcosine oxidase, subunit beta